MKNIRTDSDEAFDLYIKSVNDFLEKKKIDYKSNDFEEIQKKQLDDLVQLEASFIQELANLDRLKIAYNIFFDYIFVDKKNMLVARPFFRERQKTFSSKITPLIHKRDVQGLLSYKINFVFISLLKNTKVFSEADQSLWTIYNAIIDKRQEIAKTNAPLLLSRCKMFWKRTQQSHLDYMDMIQIATEGMMIAIDKFVPPYSTVFRSVIIGRITSGLISEYSRTPLHLYPKDRKILYRANKARRNESDIDRITLDVNRQNASYNEKEVSAGQVQDILSTTSTIPLQTKIGEDMEIMDICADAPCYRPDAIFENKEVLSVILKKLNNLPVFEQKLIRMKFAL